MSGLVHRTALAIALCVGLSATTFAAAKAIAETVDLHRLFEESCQRCHGHAGDFAREHLAIVDGVLRGRASDLRSFLQRHHGPRPAAEADALYQMLYRQVEEGGKFKERCAICHDSAAALARDRLIVVDDALRGRYSGYDIRTFLPGHARLDATGAAFFYDALLQVALGRR